LKKTKEVLGEYGGISEFDASRLLNGISIEASFHTEEALRAFDEVASSTFVEKIRLASDVALGVLRATSPQLEIVKNSLIVKAKEYACWDIHCPQKFKCLSKSCIVNHLKPGTVCWEKLKKLGEAYNRTIDNMSELLTRNFETESLTSLVSACRLFQACLRVDYRKNEIATQIQAAIRNSKRSSILDLEFSLGRAPFVAWLVSKGEFWGYQPATDSFVAEFTTRAKLSQYVNEYYLTGYSSFIRQQRWVEIDEKAFKVSWKQFGSHHMQGLVKVEGRLNFCI